jgi:hypothetical protein
MKPRLAAANLASHLRRPRSGGHGGATETFFRIGQLLLLLWLAVIGAKLAAGAVIRGGDALIRLLS